MHRLHVLFIAIISLLGLAPGAGEARADAAQAPLLADEALALDDPIGAVLEAAPQLGLCQHHFEVDDVREYSSIEPLENGVLVFFVCGLGTYSETLSVVWMSEHGTLVPLVFEAVEPGSGAQVTARERQGIWSWDDGRLEVFAKARGIGGCGDLFVYERAAWRLRLVEQRSLSCEAADASDDPQWDPHAWPLVYSGS